MKNSSKIQAILVVLMAIAGMTHIALAIDNGHGDDNNGGDNKDGHSGDDNKGDDKKDDHNGDDNKGDDNNEDPVVIEDPVIVEDPVASEYQDSNSGGGGAFWLFGKCDCERLKILAGLLPTGDEQKDLIVKRHMDDIAWGFKFYTVEDMWKHCEQRGYDMSGHLDQYFQVVPS